MTDDFMLEVSAIASKIRIPSTGRGILMQHSPSVHQEVSFERSFRANKRCQNDAILSYRSA